MNSATCKVYLAFADGPLVASPTWTEVTAYVRSVSTNRGRTSELEDFSAGTCSVVLDNTDRRFDPNYSSSPYSPNIKVRRQIKVEAVYSGTTYPVFRGLVTSWTQDWDEAGYDPTCTIAAVDLFGLLATWDLPDSAHELYARSLSPSAWWTLGDEGNVARDRLGNADGSYRAEREKVDALEVGGDGASSYEVETGGAAVNMATWTYYGTASNKTSMSCLFQARDTSSFGSLRLLGFTYSSGSGYLTAFGDSTARGRFAFGLFTAEAIGESSIMDGNPHHMLMVRDNTTVTVYVDGVSVASATGASMTGTADTLTGYIGYSASAGLAVLDEAVLFHGTALTSTQAGILSGAALTGWNKQRVDERISRTLDLLGVPSALYSLQAASSSVGPFEGGSDALAYLQAVARSDQGRLYVTRGGVITFEAKTDDMGASSAVTFADDSTANSVRYAGLSLPYDDQFVYNLVTVSGASDATYTTQDATSQTTYSVRSRSVETALPSDQACRDVAEAVLARYASPSIRCSAWTVKPETALTGSATLAWASVLGRELGDIVTLKRTPTVGSALSLTLEVTSVAHEITPDDWTVTFQGAPAYTTASFRWGTSNWGGTEGWS